MEFLCGPYIERCRRVRQPCAQWIHRGRQAAPWTAPYGVFLHRLGPQSVNDRPSQRQCCQKGKSKSDRNNGVWRTFVDIPASISSENIKIVAEGNTLNVSAVQVEESEHGSDKYEVTRTVTVPDEADMDSVKTMLLKRGGLLVHGKYKKGKDEKTGKKGDDTKTPEAQSPLKFFGLTIDPEIFDQQMQMFAEDIQGRFRTAKIIFL